MKKTKTALRNTTRLELSCETLHRLAGGERGAAAGRNPGGETGIFTGCNYGTCVECPQLMPFDP